MSAVERPVEVELKYRVTDVAAAERYLVVEEVGGFTGGAVVRSTQMADRYLDTAKGTLGKAGYAVRLRQSGRGIVVSVKAVARNPGVGGAARREELEGPADGSLDPLGWPASDARSLLLNLVGDAALVELVTIRQVRRRRIIRSGETRVELSLDDVEVVSRTEVVDHFVELEAELVKGDETTLAGLAEVFDADPALTPERGSKLEAAMAAVASGGRGRRAADPAPIEAVQADTVPADTATSDAAAEPGTAAVEAGDAGVEASDAAVKASDAAVAGSGQDDALGDAVPPIDTIEDAPAEDVELEALVAELESIADEAEALAESGLEIDEAEDVVELDALPPVEALEVIPTTSDLVSEAVEEAASNDGRLVVGKTPGVSAEDHVAEAGRKVMRFHLARMLAREAGTREGKDPEELHAMRVATRRQRAAWRVFGSSFRPRRTRRYRNGLREIAGRLGAVRDLDVLLEAAEQYRSDMPHPEKKALQPLLDDWHARRDDARVLLLRELDSDGYRRWVDDYRDFVRTEGVAVLPVLPTQPHRVRDTAASRIWTAYEQVRAYEAVLRWADVETLHELRIAGKWLRYTLEFVREGLGDEAGPLIARVTALQDHLGLMNDADVAGSLARTFLVEHAGELSPTESAAIGRYLVSREREVARLRRTVGGPWRGVAGIGFRRALGRVVAGL